MASSDQEKRKRRTILKRNSSTFYVAGLLLPKYTLDQAATLYSFCRWVDDIADEAEDSYRALYMLGKINSGLISDSHVDDLVSEVRNILKQGFGGIIPATQLIETVKSDLGKVLIKTQDELIRYCYGVAGTVGLMMCTILKAKNVESSWKHAVDLGIAMQLTNICRDVYADAELGRRYLPGHTCGNISPEEILSVTNDNDRVIKLSIKKIICLAEDYYKSGLDGLKYLPWGTKMAIYSAAVIYRQIGRSILKTNCVNWRKRSYVNILRKIMLIINASFNVLIIKLYRNVPHKAELHEAIIKECRQLK